MEATIRDLRLHTAEVLAAADRGERVTITSRGQVRAVLMRCEETRARAHAEWLRGQVFHLLVFV